MLVAQRRSVQRGRVLRKAMRGVSLVRQEGGQAGRQAGRATDGCCLQQQLGDDPGFLDAHRPACCLCLYLLAALESLGLPSTLQYSSGWPV